MISPALRSARALTAAIAAAVLVPVGAAAQAPGPEAPAPVTTPAPAAAAPPPAAAAPAAAAASSSAAPASPAASLIGGAATASMVPADYVIGAEDILSIVFWRNQEMSAEVAVRPDGRISLPLINEVQAAGLTPEALRTTLTDAATKFMEAPTVTVVVKQINSRKVSITGMVTKPGQYQIGTSATVIQLIAMAGGLLEYADAEQISVIRSENGQPRRYRVNYKDVAKGKNLRQNIELKVGDTVIVP
jgi:polysaccharide export outer membrane protein